jgi:hypothetical protein
MMKMTKLYQAPSVVVLTAMLFWWLHPHEGQRDLIAQSATTSTAAVDCAYQHEAPSPSLPGLMSKVTMRCSERERSMIANAIPDHEIGAFPNRNNPNSVREQSVRFDMPLMPLTRYTNGLPVHIPGYARNGVKLEGETAETYQNVPQGWRYEAIQNPVVYSLGLDANLGHVQPNGEYHYHGIPIDYLGRLQRLRGDKADKSMILMAWSSDGFPIYARFTHEVANDLQSPLKVARSNYRLKTAAELEVTKPGGQIRPAVSETESRRGGKLVASLPLGVFVQDWIYDPSVKGDLDECNGRFGATPEFPKGIYHYYLTDSYPYMQRCIKGDGRELRQRGGPPGSGPPGPPGAGPRPFGAGRP